jgi:CrcB protein
VSSHTQPAGPDELAAVAVGGVVGAFARAGISVALPHPHPDSWPSATFLTNVLGCLILGLVLAFVDARHLRWSTTAPRRARLARPFLATGVLGGFTTFSTFSVEVVQMVRAGSVVVAAIYVLASVIIGIAAFVVGRDVGSHWFGRSAINLPADEEL